MTNLSAVDDAIARSLGEAENPEVESGGAKSPGNGRRKKHNISPEGRKAMSEGWKKRKANREKEAQEKAAPPPPPSQEEIAAYAMLGSTVWTLMGKIIGMRPLTPEESLQLGGAMAPVGHKWMPFMEKWMPELNLVVVTVSLYNATKIHNPEPEPEPEAMPEEVAA